MTHPQTQAHNIFDNKFKQEYDNQPIVLIDNSGSTCDRLDNINVLEKELLVVKEQLMLRGINQANVLFWNSKSVITEEQPLNLNDLDKYNIKPRGGTYISQALENIPSSWLEGKNHDIYIITDGEISDGRRFGEVLKNYNSHNIYIMTVEPNSYNYLTGNCNAGNQIYQVIKNNNLTGKVKQFISFNKYHSSEPFVSFENPFVPEGYLPFRSNVFKKDNLSYFLMMIEKELEGKTSEEILKYAYDLSNTLNHLTKDENNSVKKEMIDLFSELFKSFDIYKDIINIFHKEVDNISQGKASTFQDYRRSRNKHFEKTQLGLFDNVKENISNLYNFNYLSFITTTDKGDVIFKVDYPRVDKPIVLDNRTFNSGGFKFDNFNIPILPEKVKLDDGNFDQSIRQWIRTNYAKKYNKNVASDTILYMFLTDVYRIMLSDIPEEIKKSYRDLAKVMLDRKRYGTDIKEIVYLEDNGPKTVTGYDDGINNILAYCVKHLGLNIKPLTLWYGIISSIDKELGKKQLQFCVDDLIDDMIKPKDLNKILSEKINKIIFEDISDKIQYDYTCYITLEDTSETGGYVIPPRKITEKITCAPKFVISSEGYEYLKENSEDGTFTCPITRVPLKLNELIMVPPEVVIKEVNKISYNILESCYDVTKCDIVSINKELYQKETKEEHKIKTLGECNFEKVSYKIEAPYIQQTLGGYQIQNKTQEDFNNHVYNKFPFLKNINLKKYNACLAGGFCRSILLKQRVKDLDFFLVGENHLDNFYKLLKDSLTEIKNYYEKEKETKVKFLFMYKHQFNVFEVVVVSDPNNFFGDNYKLDNFTQYNFKSLHLFDQRTIIEPETGKVFRRKDKWSYKKEVDKMKVDLENRDFSNYFEDGDVQGIRMKQRLQFVLTENETISDIFENFDLYPCRVAWDGTTYFTDKSEMAYKYMINVLNENNYSTLYDHRINKYFTYGFSIVAPELDINKVKKMHNLKLGDNSFVVKQVNGYCILSEIDSHLAEKLQSIESLEKKNADNGKSLYKSSLFCSLVSILRYVKINDISYKFTDDILIPNDEGELSFTEKKEKVKFIKKIDSRIDVIDWYKNLRFKQEKLDDNEITV